MSFDTKIKGSELYKIRDKNVGNFNYYFDKFTAFFKNGKFEPIKNPKKILFIRNDHLGDMVYCTTVFREIKNAFPKVKISVLATSSNRQIIENDKNVDEIIEMDLFWRRKSIQAIKDYIRIFRKIKQEKFDVGVDLRRSKLNMLFFLFLPRIKNRVSYYNVNGGKLFLTHPIFYDRVMHLINEHVNLINQAFGLDIKNIWPSIQVNGDDNKEVREFMEKNKIKEYVVFAPGATSETKKWPEEKFNVLIEKFHKKYPNKKILISGANNDKEMIDRLTKGRNKFTIPLINFNLRGMSIIFKNADSVVANDGVATDISWISYGKLVELSGPVDRKIFGPLKNTKIIYHNIKCPDNSEIECPCNWSEPCKKPCGIWCMDLITADEILKAIEDFIKNKNSLIK